MKDSPKNKGEKTGHRARLIVVAANKGGVGKSTMCQHLIELAREHGMRVLAVETDPQGDLAALLFPDGGKEWTGEEELFCRDDGTWLMYSPAGVPARSSFDGKFDLVVVDTAPKAHPDLSEADCVVVPIDGPLAIRDCAETIHAAVVADVELKIVVPNKINVGGISMARRLVEGIRTNKKVMVTGEVPLSPAVARASDTCAPAWSETWGKRGCPEGARKMREACEAILAMVVR